MPIKFQKGLSTFSLYFFWVFYFFFQTSFGSLETAPEASEWVALDLGSFGSSVAVLDFFKEKPSPYIIPDKDGLLRTPSFFNFDAVGYFDYGFKAFNRWSEEPTLTFFNSFSFLGLPFSDPYVEETLLTCTFLASSGKLEETVYYSVDSEGNLSFQIPASVLDIFRILELKTRAEKHRGKKLKNAVISLPAFSSNNKRLQVEQIAQEVGFENVVLVDQGLASLVGFGIKDKNRHSLFLSLHIGWSSFEVQLIDRDSGVFEVLSKHGNSTLGSFHFVVKQIYQHTFYQLTSKGEGLDSSPGVKAALQLAIIQAIGSYKGAMDHMEINVNLKGDRFHPKRTIKFKLGLSILEELLRPHADYLVSQATRLVTSSGSNPDSVEEFVISGGISGFEPFMNLISIGEIKKRVSNLGSVEVINGLAFAIEAYSKRESPSQLKLEKVSGFSVGTSTFANVFIKIVARSERLPFKRRDQVTTYMNDQHEITIPLYEGESNSFIKNMRKIGDYTIQGIPPMGYGTPKISILYEITENEIIWVKLDERSELLDKLEIATNRFQHFPSESKQNCHFDPNFYFKIEFFVWVSNQQKG